MDQMWQDYCETRNVEKRNAIVCSYLHLAKAHAGRICQQLASHAIYDEIESAAYLGLINAVERFDPTRKIKFETFSYRRIHGAVMDWLRQRDRQARTIRKFERVRDKIIESLSMDGPALEDEVVRHLEMTSERYQFLNDVLSRGREVYLSYLESSLDEHSDQIQDSDAEDPSSTIATKMFIDFILTGLSSSESTVISLYHFRGLTLRQIGQEMELTESRTCQLKLEAHERIRSKLANHPALL